MYKVLGISMIGYLKYDDAIKSSFIEDDLYQKRNNEKVIKDLYIVKSYGFKIMEARHIYIKWCNNSFYLQTIILRW